MMARSHWFRPNEIPEDANEVGFALVQSSTSNSILCQPKAKQAKFHRQGTLIYVLQNPQ